MKKITDKERLDWLEREFGSISVDVCERLHMKPCVCTKTNRKAIDAAIRSERSPR